MTTTTTESPAAWLPDAPTIAAVLEHVESTGPEGVTWYELANFFGVHHGTASGWLSKMHRDGSLARIGGERRGKCRIYVTPDHVNGRLTEVQGRGLSLSEDEKDFVRTMQEFPSYLPGDVQRMVTILGRFL